ncbi:Uncharacterized protein dnl_02520 [Desulfonema limicola]|uniref:Uncharacterized protein n=1 Tax=Desulfonema limicola TaxID=45656 RepID=A0A975GEB8_9BACT|nr:hypothetical protein [Desulfonema limicola]QTA78043.1 Uncharacterized protein dnl_02520 [Desulfonema limicola]
MSFKKNLLQKIKIKSLAQKVINSTGPGGSEKKIDKKAMINLLEFSSYNHEKERDMELYIYETGSDKKKILVLDNDLPIYNTSVSDVALRKSPTVKEMLNIRNAIKILNDSDVLVSKKQESVRIIEKDCINLLDLNFNSSDIDDIKQDGLVSLEKEYTDGVIEALALFAEILEYIPAPRPFSVSSNKIWGQLKTKDSGEQFFGPMIIYNIIHNTLKIIEEPVSSYDKGKIEIIYQAARGKSDSLSKSDALKQGQDVFNFLSQAVTQKNPAIKNPA